MKLIALKDLYRHKAGDHFEESDEHVGRLALLTGCAVLDDGATLRTAAPEMTRGRLTKDLEADDTPDDDSDDSDEGDDDDGDGDEDIEPTDPTITTPAEGVPDKKKRTYKRRDMRAE